MTATDGETRLSMIAGMGTFAVVDLARDEVAHRVDDEVDDESGLGRLNHSCDPTMGWDGGRELVALRDIAAGEELTLDYATCIDDPAYLLRCHCETYRCRQLVEGTDWQIPQLQTRYAGHWTPRLQGLIDGAAR